MNEETRKVQKISEILKVKSVGRVTKKKKKEL